MDFFSRKLLSDDDKQDDLKKLCDQYCPDSCPDLCFSIPPPNYPDPDLKSAHKRSNLVAATVAVISFTFLLVLCYAVYRRFYSGRRTRRRPVNPPVAVADEFLDEEHGPVLDHPIWYIRTIGLPSSAIDSIAVCKFKPGEGLIDGTECSVCLSEFEEDETLRLLPKCSHAFHLPCIDTWLRSHTNCPMCRAPVAVQTPQSEPVTPLPHPVAESEDTQMSNSGENDDTMEEIDLGVDELEQRIGDFQPVRRSVSLDALSALGISSVLGGVNEKGEIGERNGNCSAAMNRSVSFSGKFLMRSGGITDHS